MKSVLALTKIRNMVRLYRAEIEGAAENLESVMRDQWDELHPLLRITPHDAARLVEREDAVQALARAVEEAVAKSARARSIALGSTARRAALDLAKAASTHDGRTHQLPARALHEVLEAWRGSGDITFGNRGVVDIGRLRALARQCVGLESTIITLTDRYLVIACNTTCTRGVLRLLLGAWKDCKRLLVVPIPPLAPLTIASAIYAPDPWLGEDAAGAPPPQAPLPPQRPVLVLVR
ncbi:MAG: hypothetical protein RLZZ450_2501 [Pseudomonadota bacterium]|jgi:hypothetical protein